MRLSAFPCFVAALTTLASADLPKPDRVMRLWEGKAPGDFSVPGPETVTPPKPTDSLPILRITNVADPRLEFYEPEAAKKNGNAVVIVPGGGFGILASGHEGSDLALWFRDRGFVRRCAANTAARPRSCPSHGSFLRKTRNAP
jgi:hypothetical protein